MSMERFILNKLLDWKKSSYRKPLILKGVRQVGKTWILKEFGRQYYENTAYFNFDENEEYTRSYFAEHFPKLHIMPREGTYLLWIDYRETGMSEEELEQWFLQEANVSVYMGSVFGEAGRGYIRLNLASPRSLLEEAYERMRGAWKR